ncbi:MAG: single-stranded DNA-binding protein [Bacteroidetes bacterium]|nr:single-stranded DNA-binding protein [Bacteroidota bacterium]
MASVNRVTLVGRLGADPEVINTTTGQVVAKVSLATTDRYKDKNTGEMKETTEWHRLVFWNDLADIAGKWLKKGSQIYVEGRIKYGQYTGNDGITRYTTDIAVNTLQMLGHKGDNNTAANTEPNNTNQQQKASVAEYLSNSVTPDMDDDIPF